MTNSTTKELTYTLPGYGLLKVSLFPYTQAFLEFLSYYRHHERFHNTNHLGALRDIFHGAHNTRYEYIFIQWTFISELINQKENNLGLSSHRKEFGKLPGLNKWPSGAEVLQCLVLLTNMGHLPGTFAASRAWLHKLLENKESNTGFKLGLTDKDKLFLNKTLNNFDVYRIHLLNAAFLLQRYKRFGSKNSGSQFVAFGEKILNSYLSPSSTDNLGIKKLWTLYRTFRQVSFLILDCHYAPIPLSLDLSSIILNFSQLFEDFLVKESVFQLTLKRLEDLLQNTVYMSGDSLLAQARSTEQILKRFNQLEKSKGYVYNQISNIKELLEPPQLDYKEVSSIFHIPNQPEFLEPDWDTTKTIDFTYENIKGFESYFPHNPVAWEIKCRKIISNESCRVAAQFNPSKSLFRIAYSLSNKLIEHKKILIKSLKIINILVKFECKLHKEYNNRSSYDNHEKIFCFLLRATLGWDTKIKLDSPISMSSTTPFFIGRGSKVIAKEISSYIEKIRGSVSQDALHEIKLTQKILQQQSFTGYIACFVGATHVTKLIQNNRKEAEFDSIILLVNVDHRKNFAIIVEAKNQNRGHTAAQRQLRKRLNDFCPDYVKYSIEVVQSGAYAKLKIADEGVANNALKKS